MSRDSDVRDQIANLELELARLKKAVVSQPGAAGALTFPLHALVVRVNGLHLALEVSTVQEVIPMVWITPLPQAPEVIRGTLHFRGQLVALLDLHLALSGVSRPLGPEILIVIVSTEHRTYAITADEVQSVHRFTDADQDAGLAAGAVAPFVRGLVRQDGIAISVLDPARLLAAGEQSLISELLAEAAPPQGVDP